MAAHPQHWISPEEYLELDDQSEFRHEYYDGWVWRVGEAAPFSEDPAFQRASIIANLTRLLAGHQCRNDVAVAEGRRKADFAVYQGTGPIITIDTGFAASLYAACFMKIPTLREHVMVSQMEPQVEVFRRDGKHWWTYSYEGLEDVARFESVDASIRLAEIYEKVELGEAEF